jgi:hypothetical protein
MCDDLVRGEQDGMISDLDGARDYLGGKAVAA